MRKRITFSIAIVFIISVFLVLDIGNGSLSVFASDKVDTGQSRNVEASWIVKWNNQPSEEFYNESIVVADYSEINILVARSRDVSLTEQWVEKWSVSESVQYMQENETVIVAEAVNDPLLSKQNYLVTTGVLQAWETIQSNDRDIIAIIDTGVDLSHPDLKGNLVAGANLIDPQLPPQDDHGHGTNVAGVIAAQTNNELGISGILWNAKIMPIKTMYANGTGSESTLGEGIRYAVDHGAKIVVLSLGLNKYTPYMAEIVQYAEEKGVLLVAAVGNESNAVRYPAAYPTVLAIGGVKENKTIDRRSNYGPELDLVAPIQVFTTALRGDYEYRTGSSMAAPQVAAVAALAWMKYPDMEPYEIRNLLRQSSERLETPHWNEYTGYGLLRADRALRDVYNEDMYEPNDTREQAKPLPIGKQTTAMISSASDIDWFELEAAYPGTLKLQIEQQTESSGRLNVSFFSGNGSNETAMRSSGNGLYEVEIPQGVSYLRVSSSGVMGPQGLAYQMIPMLHIYRDSFEDNDRQYTAHKLPLRNQTIKGTFHKESDHDWFLLSVNKAGLLRVSVSVDTARMNPVLIIQKKNEEPKRFNDRGDGEAETSPIMEVLPGEYYIRVSNVEEYVYPVLGEYTLSIEYNEKFSDPNEPNNKPYQATAISTNTYHSAAINGRLDDDWYKFRVIQESLIQIDMDQITSDQHVIFLLTDSKLNQLEELINDYADNSLTYSAILQPGDYYININGIGDFLQIKYGLRVTANPTVSGFTDIANHWARGDILDFIDRKVIEGYGDHTFRPDAEITRAEAVQLLVRAFGLSASAAQVISFSDIRPDYWGYEAIGRAVAEEIVTGYPDGTFKPNQFLNREEMIVLLFRALQLTLSTDVVSSFEDISEDHWSAGYIHQMKEAGLVMGYADGKFHPQRLATRAEFVTMLSRAKK